MNEALLNKCKLFIDNRNTIKNNFALESSYMHPLCAQMYTAKGRSVDPATLKQCIAILKQKVGVFSEMRGTVKLTLAAMMSLNENPETALDNCLEVYHMLKQQFFTSSYLPAVAMTIAELAKPEEYSGIVKRTHEIYNRMKAEHSFLTSSEDRAFAALLALSPASTDTLIDEMEKCYSALKSKFFSANAVQSLSHALALYEEDSAYKCDRVMKLFHSLEGKGCRYGTSYELPTLGVLAMADREIEDISCEMVEVYQYLKTQKGFGMFGLGSKQALMYAGMLTTDAPAKAGLESAALNSAISIILAQEVAMCAALSASAAASSASN